MSAGNVDKKGTESPRETKGNKSKEYKRKTRKNIGVKFESLKESGVR
jgi:hypothetical protein